MQLLDVNVKLQQFQLGRTELEDSSINFFWVWNGEVLLHEWSSCMYGELLPCVTFTFLLQMVEKGGCDIKKTCDQNVFVAQQSLQSLKGILKE